MKRILTTLIVLSGGLSLVMAQSTMRVDGANAKIVVSGNPFVVLSNTDLANNASSTMLNAGNGTFSFQGTTATSISSTGAFTTQFYNTIFNKPGAEIDVTTDNMLLVTSNQMTMTAGNVDMNNNTLSTWCLGTSTANLGTLARTSGHFYRGYFQRWYSTGTPGLDVAQWDIPVGMNAATYNYARVYYPAATTAGTLRTMFNPVNPFYAGMPMFDATNPGACTGSLGAGVDVDNAANEGYWIIQQNTMDQVSPYTIKLNYTNFTTINAENCLRIIKSENLSSWMQEGAHGTIDVTNDWITRNAQTAFPGGGGLNTAFFTVAGDVDLNPLPVELQSFNGLCNNGAVKLNWVTASETNNNYFVIERTKNFVTWEVVTMVNTQNGNSNQNQSYSYDDHTGNGTYYYRISQVDMSGDVHVYLPITVNCETNAGESEIVSVYQNGDGQVTLILFTADDMDYTLGLYDLQGRKILAQQGKSVGGNTTIVMDANVLRDAYYLVNIQVGDKNLAKKVFVK